MGDPACDLRDVEALKQLKARYCRHLDTKNWAAFREIFTDDFVSDTSEAGGEVITGADAFVAFTSGYLGRTSQTTVHQVHSPELELTSPTTARGIWALNDVVRLVPVLGLTLHGFGHYHETYEKSGGQWRIKTSKLTRLREDLVTPLFCVKISERMRDAGAKFAQRRAR